MKGCLTIAKKMNNSNLSNIMLLEFYFDFVGD